MVVDSEGVEFLFVIDEVVNVLLSFHFLKVKGLIRKENKIKAYKVEKMQIKYFFENSSKKYISRDGS